MHTPDPDRRRCKPQVDGLESRALLTFVLIPRPAAVRAAAAAAAPSALSTGEPVASLPTPHEIVRERYVARLKGSYTTGPGRFTDQSAQLASLGYGGSNQSLHLYSQLRLTVPVDTTQPVTGLVALIPWNTATTGSNLVLDLTGDPASVGSNGFPTHFTWTVNSTSGGLYAGATGQGTLDVTYFPTGRGRTGTTQAGRLQFAINGLVNTTGVGNDLAVPGSISRGDKLGQAGL